VLCNIADLRDTGTIPAAPAAPRPQTPRAATRVSAAPSAPATTAPKAPPAITPLPAGPRTIVWDDDAPTTDVTAAMVDAWRNR
jgi:hypothetical protein